jgi:hypothetical protein
MAFPFVLYALIHYYLLLYLLFHKLETAFGCVFIAENLSNGTSTTGDQLVLKPTASQTQSSISSMLLPMMSVAATGPIRIGLEDVRQPRRTQFRLELITQIIDIRGNGCALFLPDVIGAGDSDIDTNLQNNMYN